MPEAQITGQEHDTIDYETESRINALQQLLRNSENDVIRAHEGGMTESEYTELRITRRAWTDELTILLNETTPETTDELAPDALLLSIINEELMDALLEGLGYEEE